MDKPNRSRTKKAVGAPTFVPDAPPATMNDPNIARRAYELYEKRGREHGHDLDDWLQAERELQDARRSAVA